MNVNNKLKHAHLQEVVDVFFPEELFCRNDTFKKRLLKYRQGTLGFAFSFLKYTNLLAEGI